MLSQSTINKVILLGKIVKEPKWHSESGEKELCFTIATTENVRKNVDYVQHEEYHDIRLPDNIIMHGTKLQPGQLVYVQGKIQTKQFIDDEKIRRYKTEIIASGVEVINAPQAEPYVNQERRF